MRKFIKWSLRGLGVIVLVAVIGAAWNWERLVRLYKVNTLFKEENIVANFSDMQGMFFWAPVPRVGPVHDWPVALADLPDTYVWNSQTKAVSDWLDETRTTSLLVVKDGQIVHEEYGLGTGQNDRRISWSMAKSFLSTMFGMAVAEGKISSLDDPVTKYVPALNDSAYAGVPIRHVLNMASGVKFDEDYLDFDSDINRMGRVLALGGSMDDFAAGLKERERDSGLKRQYVSIDTHILAMVLRQATGKSVIDTMIERLWSKLGVEDDAYYLTDGDGIAFALGGLNMRTRDYARFAQMMLDDGKWQGEQIVPASWIKDSVVASAPPPTKTDDKFGYGYQWWLPVDSDDEYYAGGIYGQFIYFNPKANVIIVKTSAHRGFRNDDNDGRTIKRQTIAMFRSIAAHYSDWVYPGR